MKITNIVAMAFIAFLTTFTLSAQNNNVGIGTTTPDASAVLEANSTTQGFLPPRMTNAERDAIASPAQGLMIYCTNCGSNGELQVYNGVAWNNMVGAAISSGPPILTTTAITAITAGTASSGGNITSDDGSAVTARGVCWSLNPNPTTAFAFTTDGAGTGSFISDLTDLIPGSTYYVRAYATNAAGTAYGNEFSFSTPVLSVGDAYQGGIVFYLDGNGGGLIAATSDESSGIVWGANGAVAGTSSAFGTGQANTTAIVGLYGLATAAGICDQKDDGTYSDWYLPSLDELNALYAQKALVGGFGTNSYWSSSERNASNVSGFWGAWFTRFSDGAFFGATRTNTYSVRPIRSFTGPTPQEQLNAGATPKQLFDSGVPYNSIIGTAYQGGLITYLNTTDGTGLIVAMENMSSFAAPWGLNNTQAIGVSEAIGTGSANTDAIIVAYGNSGNYAAKACRDYNGGGYTDWYLPSMGELNQINAAYPLLNGKPGFTPIVTLGTFLYYSSSEWVNQPAQYGLARSFGSNGVINASDKLVSKIARPFRSF